MTYGEAWYKHKLFLNDDRSKFADVETYVQLPKRMSKEDANDYYTKKCREVFISLGFEYNDAISFEDRFAFVFAEVRAESRVMLRNEIKKLRKMW